MLYFIAGCGGDGGGDVGGGALSLSVSAPGQLLFQWEAMARAHHYCLVESPDDSSDFSAVPGYDSITGTDCTRRVPVHLTDWENCIYYIDAYDAGGSVVGTTDIEQLTQSQSRAAIGYFKAPFSYAGDAFGYSVAISGDGNTIAVGAYYEDSSATGIDGDDENHAANGTGAVYIYVFDGEQWSYQAYIKASDIDNSDFFGLSIALSDDGNTLAVGALNEDGNATGVNGTVNDSSQDTGAAYVFARSGSTWSQQAYIKSYATTMNDYFGSALALSGDGNTLAVGSTDEDSSTQGISATGAGSTDNTQYQSGAVCVYVRSGTSWSPQAYIKASNSEQYIRFGFSVALNGDGSTLAVGARSESSDATGINGDQTNSGASASGAAYVFARSGTTWSQQAYVKASNTDPYDAFGRSVSLSDDGNILAVGAIGESSASTGVNGDQRDDSVSEAGAVYVFNRSGSDWSQQAYIKATTVGEEDMFGGKVSLSADGNILAVGVRHEDSTATGVGGNAEEDTAANAGAVHIYEVVDGTWTHKNYVKASNTDGNDFLVSLWI